MKFEALVTLQGSDKAAPHGATLAGTLSGEEQFSVSVILERRIRLNPSSSGAMVEQDRDSFHTTHGADSDDVERVKAFAASRGLQVVDSSVPKRRVILSGTVDSMRQTFGVQLEAYKSEETGQVFRGRAGTISIPQELESSVVAVLGLDNRPVAKPHYRRHKKKHAALLAPFTPLDVAQLYGFPTAVTGTGQTIGIIELGGGFTPSDLATYFSGLGVPAPTVTAVSVDGGANTPGGAADGEVMLDIEVAGAIAPGANYAVYFAPNSDKGFVDAITDAVHDATFKPSVISISWGGSEDNWTAQSQAAMNAALQDAAALGVTVTVACGDNGSTDGAGDGALHVDFPASSPFSLACGGTTLTANGTAIASEVVWNETAKQEGATGGGVSKVFPLPAYQNSANVPVQPASQFVGRGVPDVSGNADPSTGYKILVGGQNEVVGGTSAVAPLWAALIALLNQQRGKNLGFLNPTLYSLGESVFHDISSGNNDDSGVGFYQAAKGWDPCTGLGSPDGAALSSALSSPSSSSAKSGH